MGFIFLATRLAPQQWVPCAVFLAVLATLLPLAYSLLVVRLGGITWATATASVVFAFWPGLLVIETWLSAALQLMWLLCALICAHLVASRAPVWVVVMTFLLACGFGERGLFTLPLVFTIFILFSRGDLRTRFRTVWREGRATWIALIAATLVVTGLLLALIRPFGQVQSDASIPFHAVWRGIVQGTLRGLTAWPTGWSMDRGTFPTELPFVPSLVPLLVAIVLCVLGWRTDRRQTLVAGTVVISWLLIEPILVVITRADFIAESSELLLSDPRFSVASGIVVLTAIAAWPVSGQVHRPKSRAIVWAMSMLLVVALASAELVDIIKMSDGGASRKWLASARSAFTGSAAPALVSTASPPFMLNSFFLANDESGNQYEQGTTRTLLEVGQDQPVFNQPTDFPLGADDTGRAAPVSVLPVRSSTTPGFGAQCSVRVEDRWVDVPMTPTGLGNPILSVDVLASSAVTVELRGARWQQSALVAPGLRSIFVFPVPGPFDGFSIRVLEGEGQLCVGSARAGQPFVVADP